MQDYIPSNLPESWRVKSLEDISTSISAGGTPSRTNPHYWGGTTPFALIEDITECGLYLTETKEFITSTGLENSSAWVVPQGSVLVTMYATIGATAVTKIPVATNQAIAAIQVRDDVSTEFLAFSIRHYRDALIARNVQATQKNINKGILQAFEMPFPPFEEQRKIAAVLSEFHETIDLEENLTRVMRELKQAALGHLFTNGLYGEPQRETRFGPVPASWGEQTLSECAFVQTGIAKNSKNYGPDDLEVPYLRVANVQDGHLDLSEIKMIRASAQDVENSLLRHGDVLLTEGGDFDKLGRGFIWEGQIPKCVHQNHVFAVRTQADRLDARYFAYLAQSPYGKAYFLTVAHKTTNLACINTTKLRAFPVLLPKTDEQKKIASILQTIDNKISYHEDRQRLLRELFQTLLHELMTGRRRVGDIKGSLLDGAA